MKASEHREMTDDELSLKKEEISSELMNLRFQAAKGVMENPARVKLLRRDVARINTISKERQSTAGAEAGGNDGK